MWCTPKFSIDPMDMAAERMAPTPRYRPGQIIPVREDVLRSRPGGILRVELPSAEAIRAHELLWENT